MTLCNNACWSLGEMAVSSVNKEAVKPFTTQIVEKLTIILSGKKLNKSLAMNISITLGRLGLLAPDDVAQYLEKIIKQWCVSLRFLKSNNTEKHQAYKGLCYTVGRNSQAVMAHFPYFCAAIV